MQGQNIPSRKQDHVELTVTGDVAYKETTTGFERYKFVHNALPEIDFQDVDPSTEFLGKKLSFPLVITGMTGGYPDAERINAQLAEVCQELQIAIGSGSQRQVFASNEHVASYTALRKHAPGVPILANIGGAEVANMQDASAAQQLVDMLEADALAVHLNPLQEFVQPEGNPQFRGVLAGIEMLVKQLPVPIVVKEVGAGISGEVARRLADAGVKIIDVSGAGGTSWSAVELLRCTTGPAVSEAFREWGIPTAEALIQVAAVCPEDVTIIASGGIRDGVDIAKSIALGARLAGAARPMLQSLERDGQQGLRHTLESWRNDFCGVMFLTGSQTLEEFHRVPIHAVPYSPR